MTGQRYIDEVLLPHVRLFRGAVGDKFFFMDGNATCHRTLAVQNCLDSEGIQRLVWPARSPDLNPIENVWDALGRQVAGRNYPPTNKNTLIRALTEEWDKLPQQLLDNVVQNTSRKGKNTWSLLRLFDRSGRSKSESLCGLEEVLSNLQPSEFIDEHLCKYKGMQWAEFVSLWEGRTPKECKGLFRRHSKKHLSSQSGSHQSTLTRTFSRILTPASAEKDSNQDNLVSSFTKAQTENKSEAQPMSPVHINHVGEDGVKDSNDNSIAALDEIEHQIENLGTLTRSRNELKRREAMWDLFQSECMFLDDHLMVLRNGCGSPVVKIADHGSHVMSSSLVPLKPRRVEQRCTLNLSRAKTSFRWCGVVVGRGGASSGVVHVI
ncbi:uncharacterized protein TNCV_2928801 [Trichonephila clavipes]|nr:uncharacterized protein TNCV_2928801 [Trichonephila clavipes]